MHPNRPLSIRNVLKMFVPFVFLASLSLAQTAPVRIMPLGDSITGSPGCWRALLWNNLQSTGFNRIDFVGTLSGQGCGVAYDSDGEGHGGFLATDVANQNLLPGWLAATRPDIVLMHFGTNDVWNGRTPAVILAAFSKLVDQMRASNPSMKILVAQIIPVAPAGCADCPQRTIAFNNAIPAWAAGKSTSASPIVVVDQWTGFNSSADTVDGVHPNSSGIVKMANRWYPPLTALLRGQSTSPDFSLAANPSSVTITRGASAAATITITRAGGFTNSVNLSASGLPAGVSAVFSPNPASSNSSTLTLAASNSAATGTVTVTVVGAGGGLTRTRTITLTVNATGGTGGVVANGIYRITPRHSTTKALDVTGQGTTDGTNVIQWTYSGGPNQRWTVTHLGNNVYQIIGVQSGKALEVASTSTANGTNVDIRTYTGAANQRWTVTPTSGGFFRLTPVSSSGSALDVTGNSTADGANVEQWASTGGNNQQWAFQAP